MGRGIGAAGLSGPATRVKEVEAKAPWLAVASAALLCTGALVGAPDAALGFEWKLRFGQGPDSPELDQIRTLLSLSPAELPPEQVVLANVPYRLPIPVRIFRAYQKKHCDGKICPMFIFEGRRMALMLYAEENVSVFENNNPNFYGDIWLGFEGRCVGYEVHLLSPGVGLETQTKPTQPAGC